MGNNKIGGLANRVIKNHLKARQKYESNGLALALQKLSNLTEREFQIMQLIYEEHTNEQMAEKLFISLTTVISHRKKMYKKLGVSGTVGLVKFICNCGAHTLKHTDLHPKKLNNLTNHK